MSLEEGWARALFVAVCLVVIFGICAAGCGTITVEDPDAAALESDLDASVGRRQTPDSDSRGPVVTGPGAEDGGHAMQAEASAPDTHPSLDAGGLLEGPPGCSPGALYPDPVKGLIPCP